MVEYNFTTADAYFVSSPKVEILQRNKTNHGSLIQAIACQWKILFVFQNRK
jgi:hypothetical protein